MLAGAAAALGLLCVVGLLRCPAAATAPPPRGNPALPNLLKIDWRRLPDIPAQGPLQQGFQDSDGSWVSDDAVVTAFGYSGGGVPGFRNTSFVINTSHTPGQRPHAWVQLPSAPVGGRQEVGATIIGGELYFVGGFSYSAPYTFKDVLKLSKAPGAAPTDPSAWRWST